MLDDFCAVRAQKIRIKPASCKGLDGCKALYERIMEKFTSAKCNLNAVNICLLNSKWCVIYLNFHEQMSPSITCHPK